MTAIQRLTTQSHPLLSANEQYPYRQVPTKVTEPVADGIAKLEGLGMKPCHILEVAIDAMAYAKIKKEANHSEQEKLGNPYRYLKTVRRDTQALTSDEIQKAYNDVVLAWSEISPLKYWAQYDAYFRCPQNDSGLENGLFSECIFQNATSETRFLIINPHPSFAESIAKSKDLLTRNIVFAFANQQYAELCRFHEWPSNISVLPFAQLNLSKPRDRVCVFGAGEEYAVTAKVLDEITKSNCMHEKTYLYVLLPTAFVDRRGSEDDLRKVLNGRCDVQQISLFDRGAANIKPHKRCLIIALRKQTASVTLPIIKFSRKKTKIAATHCFDVPYEKLLACRLTLDGIFTEAQHADRRKNMKNSPTCILISPEIQLWRTIEKLAYQHSGEIKYRAGYRFYDFPTDAQKRTKKYDRGVPLTEKISDKVAKTPEEACASLDELLLRPGTEEKPNELASAIRRALFTKYGTSPISLKSLWYQNIPKLTAVDEKGKKKCGNYKHELCCELFFGEKWEDNPICSLIVGESTVEEINHAIATYVESAKISKTKKLLICQQMEMLFAFYYRHHKSEKNPMVDLVNELTERSSRKHRTKSNIGQHSLSLAKMRKCVSLLDQDTDHPTMAMLVKAKMYLAISSSEAAALTIGDYLPSVAGYELAVLKISKYMEQTGTTVIPYVAGNQSTDETDERCSAGSEWKIRNIPVPPLFEHELSKMVNEHWARLEKYGLSESEIKECPLFPDGDPREYLKTRRINKYCKNVLHKLGIQSMWVTDPDDDRELDLAYYPRDIFQANFEHHAKTTLKMEADSWRYLRGKKPHAVANASYFDHNDPIVLKKLALECNRLVALITLENGPSNFMPRKLLVNNTECKIPYIPQANSSELVMEFDLQKTDTLEIQGDIPHGCDLECELYPDD